jgi:iron(III) transport system substrate-binding protein
LSPCLLLLAAAGCGGGAASPRVVLYCAQDREFAEAVLPAFTAETGLTVAPKYDTEATKSVSLYTELVREAGRPRADVHWNNEPLATLRLQRQGLLEPYNSPSAAPYPTWAKAADHTWYAFAARARVLIVNTEKVPEARRPKSLFDLADRDTPWAGRVAMAKPLFGTTATQAACLFDVLGPDAAKAYYRQLKAAGVNLVAGNKQVAEDVGAGRMAVGVTDTDDAIIEVEAGRPVVLVFPDRDGHPVIPRMGTLFIPNTVAVVKGGPNPAGARRLVDFLLSPAVEGRLAESASHQIPLNPGVEAKLPAAIETPKTVKAMDADFGRAADLWDEVQTFLRNEFTGP